MRNLTRNLAILISLNLLLTTTVTAHQTNKFTTTCAEINWAPQLQRYMQAILKIPEVRPLLETIKKEGSILIVSKNTELSKQFGAFWDPDQRVICINSGRSEGDIIGSIIFELHNASTNAQISHLNNQATRGKISKEKYVESMEYIEYLNSLNASKITVIGIKSGIFPKEAYLPIYPNFDAHFHAQKKSGHSACFARNYDFCR